MTLICLKEDNLNILGNGRQPYLVYLSISQKFVFFILIVDNKVYSKISNFIGCQANVVATKINFFST